MAKDSEPQVTSGILNENGIKSTKPVMGGELAAITSTGRLQIQFPDASVADDTRVVGSVVEIVNKSFREAEVGIFLPGYQRTHDAEIAQLIRDGLLAVAYIPARDSPTQQGQNLASSDEPEAMRVVGCVYVTQLSATHGNFGMLALDPDLRGGGLGRAMVQFAEDHCRKKGCTMMQLELLVPTSFEHTFKSTIQAWYQRMAYQVVRLGIFEKEYPTLAPHLAGPVEYRIFEKSLA